MISLYRAVCLFCIVNLCWSADTMEELEDDYESDYLDDYDVHMDEFLEELDDFHFSGIRRPMGYIKKGMDDSEDNDVFQDPDSKNKESTNESEDDSLPIASSSTVLPKPKAKPAKASRPSGAAINPKARQEAATATASTRETVRHSKMPQGTNNKTGRRSKNNASNTLSWSNVRSKLKKLNPDDSVLCPVFVNVSQNSMISKDYTFERCNASTMACEISIEFEGSHFQFSSGCLKNESWNDLCSNMTGNAACKHSLTKNIYSGTFCCATTAHSVFKSDAFTLFWSVGAGAGIGKRILKDSSAQLSALAKTSAPLDEYYRITMAISGSVLVWILVAVTVYLYVFRKTDAKPPA